MATAAWGDSDWYLNGQPAMQRSNMRRRDLGGNLAALTTQIMTSVAVPVEAGDVITSVTFVSATTAAGTPANWWFAAYSSASTPVLLRQTADQLTAAWAANTAKTLPLTSPYQVVDSGVLYVAIHVKATTVPTLAGISLGNAAFAGALVTGQKVLAQTSDSALVGTAPATMGTPTTVATVPLAILT